MHVAVVGPGSGIHEPPRPPDCDVRVLRGDPGGYESLGELQLNTRVNSPSRALDALREKACALGADALVVTRDFTVTGDSATMAATALRYRGGDAGALHPRPATP